MPTVIGVTRAWRASILSALAASTHKAAFYTNSAVLDKGAASLVYSATNECSGTNYTPGGFAVTLSVNNSQDPPFIDVDDLTVSSLTVTSFKYIALYDTLASNRIWMVIDIGAVRTLANRNVVIRFPTPDINQALMRAYG